MNEFAVDRKDMDDITVLNIAGYLDAHTAPVFEDALKQLVTEDRVKIVVNFEKLSYISSAGLGVFMGFIEDIRQKGGDIKMCCMSDKVFKIFDLLGFPTLYDIVKTEEDAIFHFNTSSNS